MSSRYNPTIRSDNTRVQLSIDPNRDQRKFSSIAAFKQQVQKYKSQPKAVITSETPKWKQDYLKANSKLQKKKYQTQKDTEKLGGFINFISPSTYIGPIFNNNGKSYTDNILFNKKSSNRILDFTLDMIAPGTITGKVIKNINKIIRGTQKAKEIIKLPKQVENSNNSTAALVFRGGPLRTEPGIYKFFTSDPLYATQYGKVTPYIITFKNPLIADRYLIGKNAESILLKNAQENSGPGFKSPDVIIGKDLPTYEVFDNKMLMPSRGREFVLWNNNQIYPFRFKISNKESDRFLKDKASFFLNLDRDDLQAPFIPANTPTKLLENISETKIIPIEGSELQKYQQWLENTFNVQAPKSAIAKSGEEFSEDIAGIWDGKNAYINMSSLNPRATYVHEVLSHGTDKQIENMIAPKEITVPWQRLKRPITVSEVYKKFNQPTLFRNVETRGSYDWQEFRATLNELRFKYRNRNIDEIPDQEFIHDLSNINSYGKDYANTFISLNPTQRQRYITNLRNALKYLPLIGIGINKGGPSN